MTEGCARRVIAVGTTVVRALESAAGEAASGWTDVVITPERQVHLGEGCTVKLRATLPSALPGTADKCGEGPRRGAQLGAGDRYVMAHEHPGSGSFRLTAVSRTVWTGTDSEGRDLGFYWTDLGADLHRQR